MGFCRPLEPEVFAQPVNPGVPNRSSHWGCIPGGFGPAPCGAAKRVEKGCLTGIEPVRPERVVGSPTESPNRTASTGPRSRREQATKRVARGSTSPGAPGCVWSAREKPTPGPSIRHTIQFGTHRPFASVILAAPALTEDFAYPGLCRVRLLQLWYFTDAMERVHPFSQGRIGCHMLMT